MNHSLLPSRRLVIAIVIGLLSGLFIAPDQPPVYAHGGGTPRLTNVPVGPYRIYAWSEPEPWRVGQVHLSVAATKPNPDTTSNQVELPVTDVDITVTYTPIAADGTPLNDPTMPPVVVKAIRQDFLGTYYYEADPVLNREGNWQIGIDVSGPEGSGSTQFGMETLPERTLNWTLIAGAGVLLVVILFLIALWSRSQQPTQPVHRPHRGERRVQRSSGEVPVRKEA